MKNKYLKFLFPVALILSLTLAMVGAQSVLADDVPPTPADEISTEAPPTEEDASTPENAEETVPEILDQLPDDTTLIVLDEAGEPLPLVSNEAVAALLTGDPQWCPVGVTPGTDTLSQCTIAHASFNDLIDDLETNSSIYVGAGTIYVAWDYVSNNPLATTPDAGNDIIFDYGMVGLTDLTVQGGWDFTQDKVIGTSTIDLGTGYSLEFWDWGGFGVPGSLTLKDLVLTNSDDLFIGNIDLSTYPTADVTFENVTVDATEYGVYIETEGDVEITNSDFTNTKQDSGLIVYSDGDITLADVYAFMNYEDGVVLDNSCGCSVGNIFVSSSVMGFNGVSTEGRGLIANSNGDITISDVDISLNGGGGAELINCFFDFGSNTCLNTNPAKITVTGTNTFQGNGYNPPQFMGSGPFASVGLWIGANSDVSVDGVNATGNGAGDFAGGAMIFTENGTMSITNSTFSNSCTTFECQISFGLLAINLWGSGTTLKNFTANGNGNGDGSTYNSDTAIGALVLNMNGNLFVSDSTFNENCTAGSCVGSGGIIALASGDVYFNLVTASNNGTSSGGGGAMINAGGNVDIYCSNFSNEEVGLVVDIPTGSVLTMKGVTFSGNTIDFIPPSGGGTWTSDPNCPTNVFNGTGKGTTSALPLKVINIGGGDGADLDCENYSGTKLILENGDNLVVPCPLGGSASLQQQGSDGLPSSLPGGVTFHSGFVSVVNESGSVDGKLSKSVLVSFIIPEGVDPSTLAILYWDGSQWSEVKGAFVLTDNGKTYFAAYVNYTGTFVLVQR